ncbi:hypothetical protein WNY58_12765 [Neptuniibacter pectenicola]|uniref:HEPN domain-containing protein n=1 Tax=Neptuniibacter pectenicola TaxID=1806669 RepID=A0ABU9TU67_9GAMM
MKKVFDTREHLEKAWSIAEKISIDGSAATQFKGAMLYSTLNICDAMQLLIYKRNFVSANILFRSLFEYVFRSFWLNRLASEEQVELAMKEEKWPKTKNLHKLLAGQNAVIDLLVSEKTKIQDILHSYIHGGSQNPLSQLGNGAYIQPNIPESEVSYLLDMISISTYSILFEMAHLAKSDELKAEIMEIVGENVI